MDVVIPRLARASSRTPERYSTAALLPLVRIAAAAACGASLHAEHELGALMPLVFVIFWKAQSRSESALVAAAYHAAAAVPLSRGAQAFYGFSEFEALLLVGTMATGVGCVWGAFWISPRRVCPPAQVLLRAVGLLVVTIVPPLGALAVPSPVLAAGLWFPGWSWCGVVAFVVAVAGMRLWPARTLVVVALLIATQEPRARSEDLVAIDTHYAATDTTVLDFARQHAIAEAARSAVVQEDALTIVFPENSGGLWQSPMQRRWQALEAFMRERGQTVLLGVTIPHDDGSFSAAVQALGVDQGLYMQRLPVPLAMWRPWHRAQHFQSHPFGATTLGVHGRKFGVLVCWEIGTPWSVYGSVLGGAQALVGIANVAWLRGTAARRVQQRALRAFGALFDLPIAFAVND